MRRLLPRLMQRKVAVEAGLLGTRATLVGALGEALSQLHAELFGGSGLGRSTPEIALGEG